MKGLINFMRNKYLYIFTILIVSVFFLSGCSVEKRSYNTETFSVEKYGNDSTKEVIKKLTSYQKNNDYKNLYKTLKSLSKKDIGLKFFSNDREAETLNYTFKTVDSPQIEASIQDNYGSYESTEDGGYDDNSITIKSYTIVLPKYDNFNQKDYEKYVEEHK